MVILTFLFLVTGVALILCVFIGIPLFAALMLLLLFALIAGRIIHKKLGASEKRILQYRLMSGLIGGLLATAAYDSSRYLLFLLFPFHIWPFEAIPLFGQLLIGNGFPAPWILAAGILYHLGNGVAFGMAYSILFALQGWIGGVLWALCLEALMLVIYPRWLNIKFFEEFITVSVFGHVAYGFVLGMVCRRRFLRRVKEDNAKS